MGSIAKIIEVVLLPHGAAPESVRRGWIGCEMPTWGLECGHIPQYVDSILPRKSKGPLTVEQFRALKDEDWKIDGFSVLQETALQVLAVHAPLAAKWFNQHGFPQKDRGFRFKLKEVRVLRTYTLDEEMKLPGKLTVYDDMERGTMVPTR